MTDIDRQALRDFMAEKVMGWTVRDSRSLYYYEPLIKIESWKPDLDSNQLDMLIDKMVEDGFNYEITEWGDREGNEVVFHRPKDDAIGRISNFKDRRLAVLLAIKAAKNEK